MIFQGYPGGARAEATCLVEGKKDCPWGLVHMLTSNRSPLADREKLIADWQTANWRLGIGKDEK